MKYDFEVIKTNDPKAKPSPVNLKFGSVFTDHMFLMEYSDNKWSEGKIVPYGPLILEPAAAVLHYAQESFEGLKAYKSKDGRVLLFRPEMNARRAALTNDRMCIPLVDEGMYVEAIKATVSVDKGWIPDKDGYSLYIRPIFIANEPFIGVRASNRYLFMIILSPVGSYYEGGLAPTKLLVEDEYVRAARGGTGYSKVGGNYAAAMKAQEKAHLKGCDQVLWLDGIERRYVEEAGTSNAFFVMDDEIITPPTGETILAGVTRNSVIALLMKWGYKVTERRIEIDEVFSACRSGKLLEMFATGTAAVISPVGELIWKDGGNIINDRKIGELSQKLYTELYGIQTGEVEDYMGWTVEVK